MKSIACALLALLLLQGCGTVQTASPPAQVGCPKPPPLARVPLGPSYIDQMQLFLSGSLSAPTNSAPPSPHATAPMTR